jgi:hypothetical protein
MGCLYTFLIGYLPFFGNIPLEVFYIFIGVGLSALLVSTDRGNARALTRGTSIRTGSTLFCIYMVMSQISEFVLQSHGATQHNRCVTDTYMVIRKIITKPFYIKN